MLQIGDIVEELATRRQGKVDQVHTDAGKDIRWQVCFSDGKGPGITVFLNEAELRLIARPDTATGSGFVLDRSRQD